MDKVIKLRSLNGTHDISGATNLVDFDIPAGNKYNMSKSYVSIKYTPNERTNLTTVNATFTNARGSFAIEVLDQALVNQCKYPIALVKNAQLVSQKQGKLEHLEKIGVLKHHLKNLSENRFEQDDASRNQLNRSNDGSPKVNFQSPYLSTQHLAEQNQQRELMIPLSDILGLGSVEVLDSAITGNMRLHLNLRLSDLGIISRFKQQFEDTTDNNHQDRAGQPLTNLDDFTNNTGGNVNLTTFTTTSVTKDIEHEKIHYIGEPIRLISNNNGAGQGPSNHVITNLEYLASGKTQITVTPVIAVVANGTTCVLQNLTHHVTANAFTIPGGQFDSVELVMATSNDMPTPPGINYLTYNTEVDSYNQTHNYTMNYHLEPFTKNLYVLPLDNEYGNRVGNEPFDSYEVTLDNKPLYQRPIKVKGSVDMDLKMKTFANNNEVVKDISQRHKRVDATTGVDTSSDNRMIMFPVPFKDNSSTLLNLKISSAGGNLAQQNVLYKEVMKKLY